MTENIRLPPVTVTANSGDNTPKPKVSSGNITPYDEAVIIPVKNNATGDIYEVPVARATDEHLQKVFAKNPQYGELPIEEKLAFINTINANALQGRPPDDESTALVYKNLTEERGILNSAWEGFLHFPTDTADFAVDVATQPRRTLEWFLGIDPSSNREQYNQQAESMTPISDLLGMKTSYMTPSPSDADNIAYIAGNLGAGLNVPAVLKSIPKLARAIPSAVKAAGGLNSAGNAAMQMALSGRSAIPAVAAQLAKSGAMATPLAGVIYGEQEAGLPPVLIAATQPIAGMALNKVGGLLQRGANAQLAKLQKDTVGAFDPLTNPSAVFDANIADKYDIRNFASQGDIKSYLHKEAAFRADQVVPDTGGKTVFDIANEEVKRLTPMREQLASGVYKPVERNDLMLQQLQLTMKDIRNAESQLADLDTAAQAEFQAIHGMGDVNLISKAADNLRTIDNRITELTHKVAGDKLNSVVAGGEAAGVTYDFRMPIHEFLNSMVSQPKLLQAVSTQLNKIIGEVAGNVPVSVTEKATFRGGYSVDVDRMSKITQSVKMANKKTITRTQNFNREGQPISLNDVVSTNLNTIDLGELNPRQAAAVRNYIASDKFYKFLLSQKDLGGGAHIGHLFDFRNNLNSTYSDAIGRNLGEGAAMQFQEGLKLWANYAQRNNDRLGKLFAPRNSQRYSHAVLKGKSAIGQFDPALAEQYWQRNDTSNILPSVLDALRADKLDKNSLLSGSPDANVTSGSELALSGVDVLDTGAREAMINAVKSYIVNDPSIIDRNGQVTAATLSKVLAPYKLMSNKIPELEKALDKLTPNNFKKFVEDTGGEKRAYYKMLLDTTSAEGLGNLTGKFGDRGVTEALLNNANYMRMFNELYKDSPAMKQAVWSNVIDMATQKGNGIDFIKNNSEAIKSTFGDKAYTGALELLTLDKFIEASKLNPKIKLSPKDIAKDFTGSSTPSWASALYAMGRNVVSPQYIAAAFLSRAKHAYQVRKINDLINVYLTNPVNMELVKTGKITQVELPRFNVRNSLERAGAVVNAGAAEGKDGSDINRRWNYNYGR